MLSGPAFLIFSNLLAAISLTFAREFGAAPHSSLLLLIIGNLVCALQLTSRKLSGRPLIPNRVSLLAIFGWSFCYSLNYGLFMLYPKLLSLSDIIIAQSLAPTLAVVISGDWKKAQHKYRDLAFNIIGVTLLLLLSFIKRNSSEILEESLIIPFLMILSMFCFIGTNVASRQISKMESPHWAQSRVALLNFAMLSILGIMMVKGIVTHVGAYDIEFGIIMGVGIFLTQASFLMGLSRTEPFLSALFLSTSVPISLAVEHFWRGRELSKAEIFISILYCLFVGVSSAIRRRVLFYNKAATITD